MKDHDDDLINEDIVRDQDSDDGLDHDGNPIENSVFEDDESEPLDFQNNELEEAEMFDMDTHIVDNSPAETESEENEADIEPPTPYGSELDNENEAFDPPAEIQLSTPETIPEEENEITDDELDSLTQTVIEEMAGEEATGGIVDLNSSDPLTDWEKDQSQVTSNKVAPEGIAESEPIQDDIMSPQLADAVLTTNDDQQAHTGNNYVDSGAMETMSGYENEAPPIMDVPDDVYAEVRPQEQNVTEAEPDYARMFDVDPHGSTDSTNDEELQEEVEPQMDDPEDDNHLESEFVEEDAGFIEEDSSSEIEYVYEDVEDEYPEEEIDEQEAIAYAQTAGVEGEPDFENEMDQEEQLNSGAGLILGKFPKPNAIQGTLIAAAVVAMGYFSWGVYNKNQLTEANLKKMAANEQRALQKEALSRPSVEIPDVNPELQNVIRNARGTEVISTSNEPDAEMATDTIALNNAADPTELSNRLSPDTGQIGVRRNQEFDGTSKKIDTTLKRATELDNKLVTQILDRLREMELQQKEIAQANQQLISRQEAADLNIASLKVRNIKASPDLSTNKRPQDNRYRPAGRSGSGSELKDQIYEKLLAAYTRTPSSSANRSIDRPLQQNQARAKPLQNKVYDQDKALDDKLRELSTLPAHPHLSVSSATNLKARLISTSCKSRIVKVGDSLDKNETISVILNGVVYTNKYRIVIDRSGRCA